MYFLTNRIAKEDDVFIYYGWVNDKEVRENAISNNKISLSTHKKWYLESIHNPNKIMLIFSINSIPVGQVRLENIEGYWLIDYSVDIKYRKKGYGQQMLKDVIKMYNEFNYHAIVEKNNFKSVHIFEKFQFKERCEFITRNKVYKLYEKDGDEKY